MVVKPSAAERKRARVSLSVSLTISGARDAEEPLRAPRVLPASNKPVSPKARRFSISPRSVCRVLHKGFHVSKRRCARGFILIRLRHEKTTEKNILVSTKRVLIRLLFGMTRRIKRILPKCQVCRELQPLGKRLLRLKNEAKDAIELHCDCLIAEGKVIVDDNNLAIGKFRALAFSPISPVSSKDSHEHCSNRYRANTHHALLKGL